MEQRQWIKGRGATGDQYNEEGGSLKRVNKVMELEKRTKERCYELVNTYNEGLCRNVSVLRT